MKQNINKNPLITIVTIVFNDATKIEETILSVAYQTYTNCEYIIVDGGSTDGTVDIIKKYQNKINRFVSEPDNGIYDAMNKGIRLAKGRWIIFMNSGDSFYNDKVISNLAPVLRSDQFDLVYGKCVFHFVSGYNKIWSPEPLKNLWKRNVFSHQTLFTRTEIMKEYPFNNANIAADYEFIFRCYKNGTRFYNSNILIASCLGGGVSGKRRVEGTIARYHVVNEYNHSFYIKAYYFFAAINAFVSEKLKSVLPSKLLNALLKIKGSVFNKDER